MPWIPNSRISSPCLCILDRASAVTFQFELPDGAKHNTEVELTHLTITSGDVSMAIVNYCHAHRIQCPDVRHQDLLIEREDEDQFPKQFLENVDFLVEEKSTNMEQ
uniref:SKP1 component POZ domain-containing protein n=1 Tax=Ditylenchus dipsaci TaxID=166011 RepID=A0A915E0N2_9BILA